jgi:ribosomal-protein-alanine N-acetyltransferase
MSVGNVFPQSQHHETPVMRVLDREKEFPSFPVLETDRLVLREITMADLDWYMAHFTRPEMVEGDGVFGPQSKEAAEKQLGEYIVDLFRNRDGFRWGVSLRGRPELIGSVGLFKWARPWGHMAELGYDLQREHWGKGVMSEAVRPVIEFGFRRMRLTRIEALAFASNARSVRLLERFGFKREGILRSRGISHDGITSDDVIYSLLRSDWDASEG